MRATDEWDFLKLVGTILTRISKQYNFNFSKDNSPFNYEKDLLTAKQITFSRSGIFDVYLMLWENSTIRNKITTPTGIVDEIDEQKLEEQIREAIESLLK